MLYVVLLGLVLRLSNIIKPEGILNDEYMSLCTYLKPIAFMPDTMLRLTSVLPSILAVPLMFLAGKEFSKRTGWYAAVITSVLSFLVYYSQQIEIFSLLFLFAAASLLFMIRYIKRGDKKNLILYLLSSVLILLTGVVGVLYLLFSAIYILYKKKKLSILSIVFACFVLICCFNMPPRLDVLHSFSYKNILFLFSDYFSPVLAHNFSIVLIIPTVIALAGMAAGFRKGLGGIALAVLAALGFLAVSGKALFEAKYSIEILPILILFIALGFSKLRQIGALMLLFFISFHLISAFTPYYVTKIKRSEGHKIVGDILNYQNSRNIIFTYYESQSFFRYTDLNDRDVYSITVKNRHIYKPNPAEILSKIPIGESVSVVFLDNVSYLSDEYLSANKDNPYLPEMIVTFSEIRNSILKRLHRDFKDSKIMRGGSWTVVKAVRFK